MFKIVILHVVVAVAVANPIYPGMGYGGIGTSSVSVRRTNVMTPGIGIMTPGMGMGMGTMVSSVYGTGMGLGRMVDGTQDETLAKTVEAPEEKVEGNVKEKRETAAVERDSEVEAPVEVIKNIDNKSPMGKIRTGVMGSMGMGGPGMMGGVEAGSSRTDVVKAGMGGVARGSVGESHVSTPFGSESSVSSVQSKAGGML